MNMHACISTCEIGQDLDALSHLALSGMTQHDPETAAQVVAMVTDGHQRPEIPQEDLGPSSSFPGMGEYVKLMHNCWEQVSSPLSLHLAPTSPLAIA